MGEPSVLQGHAARSSDSAKRTGFACLGALVLLGLAACAALPEHGKDDISYAAADYSSTALYRASVATIPADGRSGFRILPVASYAFETRLALARAAEKTLDVQYYILKQDRTGLSLMRELRNAARRGVRVRILIDDLYSVEEDRVLCDLAAMPNIEVRLFNPFVNLRANRFTRVIGAALQLARVDRRMHNKLFIADNAAAVMGGRNIADEYFMTSRTSNFVDLDLFVAGPAVRDLSHAFDNYWNSSLVVPIKRLVGPNPSVARAQEDFDQLMGDASPPSPGRAASALPGIWYPSRRDRGAAHPGPDNRACQSARR